MAIKRKRTYKAKRRFRRKTTRARVYRSIRSHSLWVKRKYYAGPWVWSTNITADFWRYVVWNINLLPNINEYAAVFDQYKVHALRYDFIPRYDTVTQGQVQATMHYVIDPASTVIPQGIYGSNTLNILMENSGVKTRVLNRPISIYYKPKVLTSNLGGGTGARIVNPGWYRTTDLDVDHRGFHAYINLNEMAATNANVKLDVYVTVYAEFKNLK